MQGAQGVQGPQGLLASLEQARGIPCQVPGKKAGVAVFDVEDDGYDSAGTNVDAGAYYVDVFCIYADGFEPNNARTQATDATGFTSGTGSGTRYLYATLYPAGDEDWYVLNNVDLGGYNIRIKAIYTHNQNTKMDVYKDGSLVASGVTLYNTGAAGAHTWEVRVYGSLITDYRLDFNTTATS